MSGVIIIREMVGTSPQSWSDAARRAVATASRTVRNIKTVEVVKSTAVVEDGEIVARPLMELTLSCDQRSIDGATASEFLADVKTFLEEPGLAL